MTTLHSDAIPTNVEIAPGQEFHLTINVANLSELIDGYRIRLFGLDPQWLLLEPRRLSLFPGDSGTVDVTVTLPVDFPAGVRVVSIYVQSENTPSDFVISSVSVDISSTPRLSVTLDPQSQTSGKRSQFGIVVANKGNSIVDGVPEAVDPEEQAEFVFTPPALRLLPGERDVIQVAVTAPRPWVGPPKVRILTFAVTSHSRVETIGTLMQRPRISRTLITLLGLITAAAVFAAVLSRTLSNVVDQAKVGDKIIEQALANGNGGGALKVGDPGSIRGTVRAGTSGGSIAGVQVSLYSVDDPTAPVKTSASADDGVFRFAELPAGTYHVRFSGAGFADSWYGGGRNFSEAADIPLAKGQNLDLDAATGDAAAGGGAGGDSGAGTAGSGGISLVGLPGTVSGAVVADDPTGATATLVIQGLADPTVPAVVATIPVSANGAFELKNVPTPQVYTLVVERYGNATETRTIDLGPGASATDIEITLRVGEGVISGNVAGNGTALGGALVEATDGVNKVSTVSLTEGALGSYSLRNLAVPGVYTITVSAPGYAVASQVVELTDNTPTASRDVFLTSSQLAITGTARDVNGLLGGVTVSVAGTDASLVTTTDSQGADLGSFLVPSLPIPAVYTVTFSKIGYVDQVRLVNLDPLLGPAAPLDVVLNPNTVSVIGRINKADGTAAGLADVSLSNGTFVRSVLTASQPVADSGAFEFASVPAGSYTFSARLAGTAAIVIVVNVTAGQQSVDLGTLALGQQASISGTVTWANSRIADAEVRLYLPADFPPNAGTTPAAKPSPIDANGNFQFLGVNAPASYVIAVFGSSGELVPLASDVVTSQPGAAIAYNFTGIGR